MTGTPTAATLRDAALALADAETFTGFAITALTGQMGLRVGRVQELIEAAMAELGPVLRTLDDDEED